MGLLDKLNPIKAIGDAIEGVAGAATGLLDELITSDEERAEAKLQLERLFAGLKSQLIAQSTALFKAQRDIIVAEAGGESWLQRNWRPIAMLTFLYIVVHMVVLTPIFGIPVIDPSKIPEQIWELLKIGIGGYIVGRSVEKSVREYRKGD